MTNLKKIFATASFALVALATTHALAADSERGTDDNWSCTTSSKGNHFAANGMSYNEASNSVVSMCVNSQTADYYECHGNLQCSKVGDEPYPNPQPEPQPQPAPQPTPCPQPQPQPQPYPQPVPYPVPVPVPVPVYTCKTFGGGAFYWGQSTWLQQAQQIALSYCRANPYSLPPQCEANLRCGF